MKPMVKISIDGREFDAKETNKVLDVAKAHNVYIPTLCAYESVSPSVNCRLCLVETTNKEGRKRVVPACISTVEDGMVVQTNSEKVIIERKVAMQKLLAHATQSVTLKELAKKLGVESTPFPLEDHQNCVLCSLCTRVCHEVVGVDAISKINRSTEPNVLPFTVNFESCIACGSCVYICPTKVITMVDEEGKRTISWPYRKKVFEMAKCKVCGRYWAPVKQIEYMAKKSGQPLSFFDACLDDRS
jgi:bidirectional [NiFe] hydrogenase diaphorase subunit